MIVCYFARLGAEAKIEDRWKLDWPCLKTFRPFIDGFVLQVYSQRSLLVISKSYLGGNIVRPDTASLDVGLSSFPRTPLCKC